MTDHDREQAVELLQDLGLKTYEARSLTALCQLSEGTAKDVSKVTEVPRTRVYDAMESLERRGLVEIHHGTPKRYRAIDLEEAVRTLRSRYDRLLDSLEASLQSLEHVSRPGEGIREVWFLDGKRPIESRMRTFIDEADDALYLRLESVERWSDAIRSALARATDRGVAVEVQVADALAAVIEDAVPDGVGLERIGTSSSGTAESGTTGLAVLLKDADAVVVQYRAEGPDDGKPKAIYAEGADNGLIRLARSLLVREPPSE